MLINIAIVFLAVTFIITIYYQNAIYLKEISWEKRDRIANKLSLVAPVVLATVSYLLSRKTEDFFDRQWIDLCIFYYMIGFVIKLLFFAWGKRKMNKYHEEKRRTLQP
jgi:uncharacterized membrane protein